LKKIRPGQTRLVEVTYRRKLMAGNAVEGFVWGDLRALDRAEVEFQVTRKREIVKEKLGRCRDHRGLSS
jgi:hypothetical protein